jgi:hypothetical protein
MVNGASGAIELKVDFAYPNDVCNPDWDPNWIIRHEGTAKYFQDANWITLAAPLWWDQWYHTGSPPPFEDVGGSGIDVEVAGGYDTMLYVYGMSCVGEGLDPTGLPDPDADPICNTEICSARFRGAGRRGNDGSVLLTFYKLPHGSYILKGYHNDLVYLNGSADCGDFPPLEPRVMPGVIVSGNGVTQIHDGDTNDVDVPIHQETSDANLFARGPSVVKFDFVGTGAVEVEYLTPPGTEWEGGCSVLNAFILQGVTDGTAYEPIPTDGATNVHADMVLSWKPGEWAAKHDVYFGTDFDDVSNATTATPGVYIDRRDANEYDPPGPLELGQTYYWRIDEVNETHPNSPWRAEVWTFTVDEGKAHSPIPEDGAVDVVLDANLTWSAGDYASWHYVYFGTDRDAVMNAADPFTPPGRGRRDPCFFEPGPLEFGQTYHWRIDEINVGYGYNKGHIWTFTALRYITVDDMQSYDYMSNYITDTWLDGIQWPDYVSGAMISLGLSEAEPPDPVYDGNQSMIYSYDNSGMGMEVPYYSEIERTFDDPCDWTAFGVKALTLFFYGDPNNDANQTEQMYVGLEDTRGIDSYAEVRYGDNGEDMNDIKKQQWQQWNIDLADFTGVTLEQIKKVYIGFGDSSDPVPGGAGIVYFDAIRLYVPRCIPGVAQPEGDLNDDCVVDFKDVRIMAAAWLEADTVDVSPPDRNRLLVEYTFDNGPNDFNDTSGNEYHAVSHGSYPHTYTVDGNLVLSGERLYVDLSYVDIPLGADNPFGGTGDYSIQITFRSTNGTGFLLTSAHPIKGGDEDNSLAFYTQIRQGWENLTPVVHILHRGELDQESIVDFNDRMHTVVVTYDALRGTMRYYDDGFQDRTWKVRYGMAWYDEHVVRIGGCASRGARNEFPVKDNLIGEIDSFRIYNYVLSVPEVMYLTTNGTGVRPIVSEANLYNEELPGSRAVNFRDFAVLADAWLEKLYWP